MEVTIPSEYVQYVRENGCFGGFTTDDAEPGYVELWELEAIPENNHDIDISKYAAGFIAFAANGGGEVLAFDFTGAVCMLALIGVDVDCAIFVANDFQSLAKRFVR
ncbi:SMI1/KNR4 family protein [Pseudoduganella sp.]|uniref:SMI1/KNR4 family protein n=1 Tax=Pseudoduganella sp. TaxID=1880898 RepID=UPI0035B045A0